MKTVIGAVCESPLVRPFVRRSALDSVNVVYYHYVGIPDPHYAAFYSGCTVSKFAEDLERLNQVFDFVSLSQAVVCDFQGRDSNRPVLAVTFDDGFDLGNNGVIEILDRYGIRATTFVITSCIDNRQMMWRHMLSVIQTLVPEIVWRARYNELALSVGLKSLGKGESLIRGASHWKMNRKDELAAALWSKCDLLPVEDYLSERKPYLGWKQLQDWLSAGHSVGFHTHTHPYCSRLTREDLDSELIQPAINLKRRLGIEEMNFSYPFGERLQSDLEAELFQKGIFQTFFGIRGFKKYGVSNRSLERAGLESVRVGWAVFAQHLFGGVN